MILSNETTMIGNGPTQKKVFMPKMYLKKNEGTHRSKRGREDIPMAQQRGTCCSSSISRRRSAAFVVIERPPIHIHSCVREIHTHTRHEPRLWNAFIENEISKVPCFYPPIPFSRSELNMRGEYILNGLLKYDCPWNFNAAAIYRPSEMHNIVSKFGAKDAWALIAAFRKQNPFGSHRCCCCWFFIMSFTRECYCAALFFLFFSSCRRDALSAFVNRGIMIWFISNRTGWCLPSPVLLHFWLFVRFTQGGFFIGVAFSA